MKIPPQSNLTDVKYKAILSRIAELEISLEDIEEKFVRGGGSGGQKINKTSNVVQLKHLATGLMVKYQKHRERSMNRILALRELLEKFAEQKGASSGQKTKAQLAIEKIRKQKSCRKRRVKKILPSP